MVRAAIKTFQGSAPGRTGPGRRLGGGVANRSRRRGRRGPALGPTPGDGAVPACCPVDRGSARSAAPTVRWRASGSRRCPRWAPSASAAFAAAGAARWPSWPVGSVRVRQHQPVLPSPVEGDRRGRAPRTRPAGPPGFEMLSVRRDATPSPPHKMITGGACCGGGTGCVSALLSALPTVRAIVRRDAACGPACRVALQPAPGPAPAAHHAGRGPACPWRSGPFVTSSRWFPAPHQGPVSGAPGGTPPGTSLSPSRSRVSREWFRPGRRDEPGETGGRCRAPRGQGSTPRPHPIRSPVTHATTPSPTHVRVRGDTTATAHGL